MFIRALAAAAIAAIFVIDDVAAQTTAETFGTIAETWDAEISPDGGNLALGCSPNGVPAICI